VQEERTYKQGRFPADAFFTAIFGGLLLMMGRQTRSESLFYYFRLEDQIPENHLLRLINRHVSFDFVREKRDTYSDTSRLSIDPEVLLRILLIGYLHGITSERNLWRSCACIWRGAGSPGWRFDQEIPTISFRFAFRNAFGWERWGGVNNRLTK
jgi:hypothetical protein